jgi:hypothetical protein
MDPVPVVRSNFFFIVVFEAGSVRSCFTNSFTFQELAANGRSVPRDTSMPAYVYGQYGTHDGAPLRRHGTEVLSNAWGVQLGLARNAQIVVPSNTNADPADKNNKIQERYLESLVRIVDEVTTGYPNNKGTIIINMSFGWLESDSDFINPQHFNKLCKCNP